PAGHDLAAQPRPSGFAQQGCRLKNASAGIRAASPTGAWPFVLSSPTQQEVTGDALEVFDLTQHLKAEALVETDALGVEGLGEDREPLGVGPVESVGQERAGHAVPGKSRVHAQRGQV